MKRWATVAAFGAIVLGGFAAPAQAVTHDEIMSVLNAERTANGIPPLVEDPALSAGCAAHNNYAMLNGSPQTGYFFRDEDPVLPGYTPEGDAAAPDSQFSVGSRPVDSFANGNPMDLAPLHLFNLMLPDLKTVGVDQLDFSYGAYGTLSLVCINVRSAPRRTPPRRKAIAYNYVGPDGTPPTSVVYEEGPGAGEPSGPWVFTYYRIPKDFSLGLISSRAVDENGKPFPQSDRFRTSHLNDGGWRPGTRRAFNVVKGFNARIPAHGSRMEGYPEYTGGSGKDPESGWKDWCDFNEKVEIWRNKRDGGPPDFERLIKFDWDFARRKGHVLQTPLEFDLSPNY